MNVGFLVLHPDGTTSRETVADLMPEDQLVFEDSSADTLDAAGAALQAEIEAAGGVEEWRALSLRQR